MHDLGFVSAIMADKSFEEVITFASENKFKCVEIMCWPKGKAERRYAGVTHIDVADFDAPFEECRHRLCLRASSKSGRGPAG